MREISSEKIREVKIAIDRALEAGANPIAAFDADGTLWDMDLGEHFFDYQIKNQLLPDLPRDPWAYYREFHDRDTANAFLWLAQINKGQPLEVVRKWAKAAVDELHNELSEKLKHMPIFESSREIINHLHSRSVQVYVVTASIKWAVEPGALLFNIPHENVIGVTTHIQNGIVTDKLDGVVTWREGKVTGLLSKTKNEHAFLAAGNTTGDLALLESATHLRIANTSVPKSHVNFSTERKLQSIAAERGWHIFDHLS
jgi:phosphoserine phosphatase